MSSTRITELQDHIGQLQGAIIAFERTNAQLRERRRGATDHLMLELDERLEVNIRTTDCLRRSLELARLELARAEADSRAPFGQAGSN